MVVDFTVNKASQCLVNLLIRCILSFDQMT